MTITKRGWPFYVNIINHGALGGFSFFFFFTSPRQNMIRNNNRRYYNIMPFKPIRFGSCYNRFCQFSAYGHESDRQDSIKNYPLKTKLTTKY